MAFMEVLLREDIDNLGDRGEIVRVRLGYGRNYLLPRGLAVEASAGNVRQIENEKRVLAKREAREKAVAEASIKDFMGRELTFERKVGEEGRLFGSVTVLDISHALEEAGTKIDRHKIRLKDPIKQVGEYEVPIRLHRDVVANLRVVVTPEGGMPAPAPQPEPETASAEAAAQDETAAAIDERLDATVAEIDGAGEFEEYEEQ